MFRIDVNNWIHITQGDSAEIDMRIFNQDLPIDIPRKIKKSLIPLHCFVDSQGNPILTSEGYPVYPIITSEGIELLGESFRELTPYPFPHNQEERIKGDIELLVEDLGNEVVLDKHNDEYANTIFLEPDDTDLEPGYYFYSLTYVNEFDEIQTIANGLFEIVER